MDALVTRTLSSRGHKCSGNRDVIVVRTWMLWPFASHEATKCRKYRRFGMEVIIVRTRMLWPRERSGHTNVIIARTWMLCGRYQLSSCQHGCAGNTDDIIVRTRMLCKKATKCRKYRCFSLTAQTQTGKAYVASTWNNKKRERGTGAWNVRET